MFHENLKYSCRGQNTLAEICRKTAINRQQFNKYLNGTSIPSSINMMKLSEFFHLPIEDFFIPHDMFTEKYKKKMVNKRHLTMEYYKNRLIDSTSFELAKYVGFYFSYYRSINEQMKLTRTLIKIEKVEGRYYSRAITVIREGERFSDAIMFKYKGEVFYQKNAIVLQEYEYFSGGALSQTILMPAFTNYYNRLYGVTQGVPCNYTHVPTCSIIVFVPIKIDSLQDLRNAVNATGRFTQDSEQVPEDIREKLYTSASLLSAV